MSHTTRGIHPEPYTPDAQRRSRSRLFFSREITWKDVLLTIAAIVVALGWTVSSPAKRIDGLDRRMTTSERRIDTLAEQQRFTNYMLCVQARRTDPASAPLDCAPIINARKKP